MSRYPKNYKKEEVAVAPAVEQAPKEAEVSKEDQINAMAARIVSEFDVRYDRKRLIILDIDKIKEEYKILKEEYEKFTRGYEAQVRASRMLQADMDGVMRDKQLIKNEIEKEKQADIKAIERMKAQLTRDQAEYVTLLEQAKKDFEEAKKGVLLLKREREAMEQDKLALVNSLEQRENQLKTQQAAFNDQIRSAETIKVQSEDALKRLGQKRLEIEKETSILNQLKESTAKEINSLDVQRKNIALDAKRNEEKLKQKEQELVFLKEHYVRQEKFLKDKEKDIEIKALEVGAQEARINKLIKKHQLEEEIKK